jgi:hypothetical protein
VAANGNYVVVWAGVGVANDPNDPDQYGLLMRLYSANGSPLTDEIRVNQTNEDTLILPDVAMDCDGNFVVAWQTDDDTTGHGIWAQRFDKTGSFVGDPIPVSYDDASIAPSVAMDADGDFVVTWANDNEWIGSTSLGSGLFARHYDANFMQGDTPEDQFLISADGSESSVAMDPNGNFAIAWKERYTVGITDYYSINVQRYDADGTPNGSMATPTSDSNQNQGYGPDIALDADGDYVVAWVDPSEVAHFSATTINGGTPESLAGEANRTPSVSMDAYGNFAIAWQVNISGEAFYVAEYEAGSDVALSTTLHHDPSYLMGHPDVAVAPGGGYKLTSWQYHSAGGFTPDIFVEGFTNPFGSPGTSTVTGRHIFYNQSLFDGNNAAIDATNDNAAIATDKSAYIPGAGVAVFGNITSFHRGINGIMVDLSSGGAHAGITACDFIFKVGNNNSPSGWSAAPAPSAISVIADGGGVGVDRVEITWANGDIANEWLEVQVLATAYTGLAATDVHFWGNRIGDTGDTPSPTLFATNSTDASRILANIGPGKPITDLFDVNRDGKADTTDSSIVFANIGNLLRIDISGGPFAPEGTPLSAVEDAGLASGIVAWGQRAHVSESVAASAGAISLPKQETGHQVRAAAIDTDDWRAEALFAAGDALDEILFELDDELLEPVLA